MVQKVLYNFLLKQDKANAAKEDRFENFIHKKQRVSPVLGLTFHYAKVLYLILAYLKCQLLFDK